jgi:hypothetical protein
MTSVLLLAAAVPNEAPMTQPKALIGGCVDSVAACHISLNTTKDEFMRSNQWILADVDTVSDMCAELCDWSLRSESVSIILGFNALFLIRRLAGLATKHQQRFLPASWWCGTKSRTYDICRYLGAGDNIEPIELLRHAGIACLDSYVPHVDACVDLKYLVELADKYHIINAKLEDGLEDLPETVAVPETTTAQAPRSVRKLMRKKVTK